jgi:hypothetical protein
LIVVGLTGIDRLEFSLVEVVDAEGGRPDRQSELHRRVVELRYLEVCVRAESDEVPTGKLDFRSSIRAGIDLIIFIERQIGSRLEPFISLVLESLKIDLSLNETYSSYTNKAFLSEDGCRRWQAEQGQEAEQPKQGERNEGQGPASS